MNKNLILAVGIIALFVILFSFGRDTSLAPEKGRADTVVSQRGIHWHPELVIVIKGEKQAIPAAVGIGTQYASHPQYDPLMRMTNMHTHDASGTLHWEVMRGPVRTEDVLLGQFFSVWGKPFTRSCILDFCNGSEGTVQMLVNGKENTEFESYEVQDKDNIEIIFE